MYQTQGRVWYKVSDARRTLGQRQSESTRLRVGHPLRPTKGNGAGLPPQRGWGSNPRLVYADEKASRRCSKSK
eukprot:6930437-Heterocapsa_arctica.AAC.1